MPVGTSRMTEGPLTRSAARPVPVRARPGQLPDDDSDANQHDTDTQGEP
ncbi:MAG: hypothetical protein JWQ26_773 [Modestobacter sp.]|jgi:hypothetical protein|nr:hypothetical protein [Modestobacter sp.]